MFLTPEGVQHLQALCKLRCQGAKMLWVVNGVHRSPMPLLSSRLAQPIGNAYQE